MDRLDGGKSQRSRGGGGRAPRAQSMGGALGPAHALVLRSGGPVVPRTAKRRRPPGAPQRQPAPPPHQRSSVGPTAIARGRRKDGAGPRRGGGAAGLCPAAGPLPGTARQRAGGLRPPAAPAPTPTATRSPTPAHLRRPYGGGPGAQEGRGGPTGGGGVWRPGAALRAAPRPAKQKSGARGQRPRAPLFQGASRPAAAVRKGRCALPPRRLPSTPLLTGLPPRFFRHWRRSAPAVRKGRCALPPRRLPSAPLLTGLPPRFFRHWRRSAPAVRKGRCALPPRRLPSAPLLTGLPPRFFRHWRRSAPPPSAGFPTNAKKRPQREGSHKPSAPLPMSGAPA